MLMKLSLIVVSEALYYIRDSMPPKFVFEYDRTSDAFRHC
jgi:hypothetical protein